MPVAGVDEELRALDCLVELARGVEVSLERPLVLLHDVDLHRDGPRGHGPPNSSGGMQLWNSKAPFAPGLVCASICAGIAPSENPA